MCTGELFLPDVLLLLLRRKLLRPALDGTLLSSDFILGLLSPPSAGVSAPMMAAEGYSIIMLELSSTGANGGDYPQPTATRGYEAKYYKVDCILTNYRIVSSWRELSICLLVGWLWCVEFVAYVTFHACAYVTYSWA